MELEGEGFALVEGYYITEYNGAIQKPTSLTVKIGEEPLVQGTDYTWKIISTGGPVSQLPGAYYSAGKNAGYAIIAITGIGEYRGMVYGIAKSPIKETITTKNTE